MAEAHGLACSLSLPLHHQRARARAYTTTQRSHTWVHEHYIEAWTGVKDVQTSAVPEKVAGKRKHAPAFTKQTTVVALLSWAPLALASYYELLSRTSSLTS